MVNRIGKFTLTSGETRYPMAIDIGGFSYIIVQGSAGFDMSVNDNQNYITYDTSKTLIPGPVHTVYVKNGSGTLNYWAFD